MKAWPLVLVLAACSSGPRPTTEGAVVVGHGAGGADGAHPMNTEKALRSAVLAGVDGAELDVQLTADSVLICYHDERLESLTNCSGLVNDHGWAGGLELCNYTDGNGADRLLSLKTATDQMDSMGTVVMDCKLFAGNNDWPQYLDAFARALRDHALQLDFPLVKVVECQVTEFLDRIPKDGLFILLYYTNDFDEGLTISTAKGYHGITISADRISAEQVAQAHARGLIVAVFGIAKASDAAHLGADILEVDEL